MTQKSEQMTDKEFLANSTVVCWKWMDKLNIPRSMLVHVVLTDHPDNDPEAMAAVVHEIYKHEFRLELHTDWMHRVGVTKGADLEETLIHEVSHIKLDMTSMPALLNVMKAAIADSLSKKEQRLVEETLTLVDELMVQTLTDTVVRVAAEELA